jgi:L-ascorbate metabolism protein UlaG (beta-lactamase superfamily)
MLNRLKVLSSALALCLFAAGEVNAQSNGWTFPENDNNVIKAQQEGGSRESTGKVTLDFFGHMAFRITSPRGTSVLIDPWRNDPSGAWGLWFPKPFPPVPVDIVLSTHAHFDHDAVERPHAIMVLERMAGDFKLGDVQITGLADKHQCQAPGWYHWTDAGKEFGQDFCPPDNALHMDNFIQVVSTGGIRIAHWGDNRAEPSAYAMKMLKDVDVLILPIDGSHHILSNAQVKKIIEQLNPKIVIPAHYHTVGASSVLTTLSNADEWVNSQPGAVKLDGSRLVLTPGDVKNLHARVYYFGNNFAKE